MPNLFYLSLDIDECADSKHNCKENEKCENNKGSFTCPCKEGFEEKEGECAGM